MVDIAPESHIPLGSSPAQETRGRELRGNTIIDRIRQNAAKITKGKHLGTKSEATVTQIAQENKEGDERLTVLQNQAKEAREKLKEATDRLADNQLVKIHQVRTDLSAVKGRVDEQEAKMVSQTALPLPELKLPASTFVGTPEVTQEIRLGKAEIVSASPNGTVIGRVENTLPSSQTVQDTQNPQLTRSEVAQGVSIQPSLIARETPNIQPQYVEKPQAGQPYNHLTQSEMANGVLDQSLTIPEKQSFFSKISAGISKLWNRGR